MQKKDFSNAYYKENKNEIKLSPADPRLYEEGQRLVHLRYLSETSGIDIGNELGILLLKITKGDIDKGELLFNLLGNLQSSF